MSYHVLIADALSSRAREILEAADISVEEKIGLNEDELCHHVAKADAVLVRSGAKITQRVLDAGKRLKLVGRAGIGVDNIDVKAATERGIVVMNTPLSNAITTAEHSISLLMAMARHIPAADKSVRSGSWAKSQFLGVELYGKTMGLVGCGTIGSIVADRALGMKMRVLVYDPYLPAERITELGAKPATLDEVIEQSDFISLHVPLTEQTKHLISVKQFNRMRKGVHLVNCARGGIVDEKALYDALLSGQVAAAALDVFESEPPAKDNPLFDLPNLICTPHLGASTREAQDNVAVEIAEQATAFLTLGEVKNAINRISMSASTLEKLRPYINLIVRMGYFLGQSVRSGISELRLDYHGKMTDLDTHALTELAIAAVLSPNTECVNLVNARKVAEARGISIAQNFESSSKPFVEMITISVTTERSCRSLSGTLFADKSPRLVTVDQIPLESAFNEHMLFIRHTDAPGLIGDLGKTLADNKVNIATLNLGRQAAGGEALALLGLDQPVCDTLLPKIRELPHIIMAQCLSFDQSNTLI